MRHAAFGRTLVICLGLWCAAGTEKVLGAAGEYRPLVVVSLASYEKILGDLSRVLGPRQTALVQGLIGAVHRVPIDPRTMAPAGLDPRRPWGLVMETEGQTFPIYGFIPVTDLGTLLAGPVAARMIRAPEQGVYRVKVQERTWYVGQKGRWALLASSRPGLATVPAEPEAVLKNMQRSYDVAVRVSLANLPADAREAARRWGDEQHHLVLDRQPGESAVEYALRNALADQGLRRAADLAVEGDSLLAGLSLDLRTRSLVADAEVTYRPKSAMAQGLARTFGKSVDVVVGIGDARLYVGAGRHPLELLKQAIRGSRGRAVSKKPPVYFSLRPGPVARLLADLSQGADRARLAWVAGLLEQSSGRDRVRLTGVPVTHGMHLRLEIEEGVFRAAVLAAAGNPPP